MTKVSLNIEIVRDDRHVGLLVTCTNKTTLDPIEKFLIAIGEHIVKAAKEDNP